MSAQHFGGSILATIAGAVGLILGDGVVHRARRKVVPNSFAVPVKTVTIEKPSLSISSGTPSRSR